MDRSEEIEAVRNLEKKMYDVIPNGTQNRILICALLSLLTRVMIDAKDHGFDILESVLLKLKRGYEYASTHAVFSDEDPKNGGAS